MIVYGDRRRKRDLQAGLLELGLRAETAVDHGSIRDLVVDYGDLELALLDCLFPERDDRHPAADVAGAAAEALGRAFSESWLHGIAAAKPWLARFRADLAGLNALDLPEWVEHGSAEGYAFYALYPECYLVAAQTARRTLGFDRAVVLGLRGIGASLSAVVAGALRMGGCAANRLTVRPRGHPFDRRPVLSARLADSVRSATRDAAVLIVDEGPGLSGSSFAGTAALMSELGVPDDRIVLLPSWEPDPESLSSDLARSRWRRHPRFVAEFEDVWPARSLAPHDGLQEISGGAWRALVYHGPEGWPAVQPQHERRKYLARNGAGLNLLKFAGLGAYGAEKQDMARTLADAGWSPPVLGLTDGFSRQSWVEARPLQTADMELVLHRLADYVAFRRAHFPLGHAAPIEPLFAMAAQALDESFGAGASAVLDSFDRALLSDVPAVAVDGRMLPHEWGLTADRLLIKSDSVDHHVDHFSIASRDALWDLAGASIEFELGREAERALVDRYAEITADPTASARLPFYRLAYAAWRLGYCQLAAQTLRDHPDGMRFQALSARLRNLLAATAGLPGGATGISARAGRQTLPCPL